MKRLWLIVSFAALLVVLGGCTGLMPIYNASFRTDFQDQEDGTFYICDTQNTLMTYEFSFRDTLVSWTHYLRGVETGERGYIQELSFYSPGVTVVGDRVTYSFIINAGTAPLSVDKQAVAPQTILVDVGETTLVLEGSASDSTTVRLSSLPIIIRVATGPTCPAN